MQYKNSMNKQRRDEQLSTLGFPLLPSDIRPKACCLAWSPKALQDPIRRNSCYTTERGQPLPAWWGESCMCPMWICLCYWSTQENQIILLYCLFPVIEARKALTERCPWTLCHDHSTAARWVRRVNHCASPPTV